MPVTLRVLCVFIALLIAAHACIAPLVGPGWLFLLPVAVDVALLSLIWSLSHRKPETFVFLLKASPVIAVLTLAFGLAGDDERWSWVVRTHAFVEGGAWLALFFVLRSSAVGAWFHDQAAKPTVTAPN